MRPALEQLVREAMEVTGAARPELLEEDSPILDAAAIDASGEGDLYLIGLIGGKEVGKSALVNALVGKAISAVTSHGAGTESVIAYAHVSQQQPLKALLERIVPGQYRIVSHDLERLRRQVLVDLPDIDSQYATHLEITRTMLRHLLFPVWVGSVEKYADLQPQRMLARVAEGNSPGNFIFCLNKADQLSSATALADDDEEAAVGAHIAAEVATPWDREFGEESGNAKGAAALTARKPIATTPASSPLEEIRGDYAQRIARTLKLTEPPHVYLISAKNPTRFELPILRELLSRQKPAETVRESKQQAIARQDEALLAWIDKQELPLRAQRLAQLNRDAEELVGARVGAPILERLVPRLLDDPGARMAMADDILQDRVARWPIVNLIHTLLQPVFAVLRNSVARTPASMQGTESMVEVAMKETGESVSGSVRSAFAQLRQTHPAIASLYPHNRLWDDMSADLAASQLRRALGDALERQRQAVREKCVSRGAIIGAPFRWLLTLGALLWFPFVQPILAIALPHYDAAIWHHFREIAALLIGVLGVDYLLKSAGFLIIYYAALWLALRWNTQRQVNRFLAKWRGADHPDASANLATQTINWLDGLTRPIREAAERMEALATRAVALRATPAAPAIAASVVAKR